MSLSLSVLLSHLICGAQTSLTRIGILVLVEVLVKSVYAKRFGTIGDAKSTVHSKFSTKIYIHRASVYDKRQEVCGTKNECKC